MLRFVIYHSSFILELGTKIIGYQKLLKEKASDIRDKETESFYKNVISKKIDYTYTYNDLYERFYV